MDFKTLREIAVKHHISRTALFKRIAKIPNFKQKHMKKHLNMWLVDQKGVQMITKPKRNSTSDLRPKPKGRTKQTQLTKNDYIKMCRKLIQTNASQQATIHNLTNQLNSERKLVNKSHSTPKLTKKQNHNWIDILKKMF